MLTHSASTPSPNDVENIYKESNEDSTDIHSKLPLPKDIKKNKKKKKKNEIVCPEYDCIPERARAITEEIPCPTPTCPSGYQTVIEKAEHSLACSKYKCELIPQHDVVCNITGRTFSTFDGVEFKYDVCDHILVRDLAANNWTVSREFLEFFLKALIFFY